MANTPGYDKRKQNPTRWGVVVETPTYDLRVFKVYYGKMTLKIYTKGARVLRVEVIVHNTNPTIRHRPITITNTSGPACETLFTALGDGRIRIDNPFLIFS